MNIHIAVTVALTAAAALTGCVKRTLSISSDPSGALVWVNDREIGRTPVDVEFVHYGTFDVRLEREGFEPVMSSAHAKAPWWDLPGPDLVAEVMPIDLHSQRSAHFVLEPSESDADVVIERARQLRSDLDATTNAPDSAEGSSGSLGAAAEPGS